ncbi:MAG TPA: hypothetical protein VGS28_04605 [Candidatus Saccharimonadales bacterium]|nr:hypothetical protein [Candidatus Saccharimonadales bacterium]
MFGLTVAYILTLDNTPTAADCVAHQYNDSSYQQTHYSVCVKDVQGILDGVTSDLKNSYGGNRYSGTQIPANGYFNAKTATEIEYFQSSPLFAKYAGAANGAVGPQTWGALCFAAYNYIAVGNFGSNDFYSLVSCHNHSGSPEH